MAKVKVTVRFKIAESIKRFLTQDDVQHIANMLRDESKEMIAAGISPVRGERKLAKYKNPKSYPGDLKNKSPVNLKLTGEMLDWLRAVKKSETIIEFGIPKNAPTEVQARARYHQEGTENMAARPFIPSGDGQEFAMSIMAKLKAIYSRRLSAIIKKSNE